MVEGADRHRPTLGELSSSFQPERARGVPAVDFLRVQGLTAAEARALYAQAASERDRAQEALFARGRSPLRRVANDLRDGMGIILAPFSGSGVLRDETPEEMREREEDEERDDPLVREANVAMELSNGLYDLCVELERADARAARLRTGELRDDLVEPLDAPDADRPLRVAEWMARHADERSEIGGEIAAFAAAHPDHPRAAQLRRDAPLFRLLANELWRYIVMTVSLDQRDEAIDRTGLIALNDAIDAGRRFLESSALYRGPIGALLDQMEDRQRERETMQPERPRDA